MPFWLKQWVRAVLLPLCLVVSSTGAVIVAASTAAAIPNGPPCRPGGVQLVFARGSDSEFVSDEMAAFAKLAFEMRQIFPAIDTNYREVGNFDANNKLGPGEYPAAAISEWSDKRLLDGYGKSVEIGTNELIAYLNHRVTLPGCDKEAIVLGGFSQGADVVGWALERTGWGALNAQVHSQIAYVALYGDPRAARYTSMCNRYLWARGDASCLHGVLGARWPYLPDHLEDRTGSWCDIRDGVCNGYIQGQGRHTTIYPQKWIPASAHEVASAAVDMATRLYPVYGPRLGAVSRETSTLERGMVLRANEYIRGRNRRCTLTMQTRGNLVLREGDDVLWSNGTSMRFGAYLGVQGDGNMVIYHNGDAIWVRGHNDINRLVMQDDCNLVAYDVNNNPVWATNTHH